MALGKKSVPQKNCNSSTVKPELSTISEQRPPVSNDQPKTLLLVAHLYQTAIFSGPKGGRCTQV
jgi:hypothetical protein